MWCFEEIVVFDDCEGGILCIVLGSMCLRGERFFIV